MENGFFKIAPIQALMFSIILSFSKDTLPTLTDIIPDLSTLYSTLPAIISDAAFSISLVTVLLVFRVRHQTPSVLKLYQACLPLPSYRE